MSYGVRASTATSNCSTHWSTSTPSHKSGVPCLTSWPGSTKLTAHLRRRLWITWRGICCTALMRACAPVSKKRWSTSNLNSLSIGKATDNSSSKPSCRSNERPSHPTLLPLSWNELLIWRKNNGNEISEFTCWRLKSILCVCQNVVRE